jgi:FkbM family methyltransferase
MSHPFFYAYQKEDKKAFKKALPMLRTRRSTVVETEHIDTFCRNIANGSSVTCLILDRPDAVRLTEALSEEILETLMFVSLVASKEEIAIIREKLYGHGFKHLDSIESVFPGYTYYFFIKDIKSILNTERMRFKNETTSLKKENALQKKKIEHIYKELENIEKQRNLKELHLEKILKEFEKLKSDLEEEKERKKLYETELIEIYNKAEDLKKDLVNERKARKKLEKFISCHLLVSDEKNNENGQEQFISDVEPFFYGRNVTYVDVGAYNGMTFKAFFRKLKIREAHLFEPNPHTLKRLLENIKDISIPVLRTYPLAVSKSKRTLKFMKASSMTKEISSDLDNETFFEAMSITLDAMTSIFTDGKINILKIDVEGDELYVLKGAKKLLQNNAIDIIYIEAGFDKFTTQQTYFLKIEKFLSKYGYRIFKIYEQVNEWIEDGPVLRRANLAYMSEAFYKRNSYKLVLENFTMKRKLQEREEHGHGTNKKSE